MPNLEIRLLGAPQVILDGAPVAFRLRKSLALLVYLAATGQPHSRDKLATLLWPGYDQSSTRAYLRKALSLLQQDLPGDWLSSDRHQVALPDDSGLWLDVDEFQRLAEDSLDGLEHAAALYTGDFLDGFSLPDADGFEEWRRQMADSLRARMLHSLQRLTDGLSEGGETARALAYARRRAELDPYDEAAHIGLMRLYVAVGQSGQAIRHYESFARLLREEVGVEPGPESVALRQEIVENGRRNGATAAPAVAESAKPAGPPSNLPHLSTSFVGREEELAQIARQVADPACRLLTLAGPGGMGKSRLAIEAGARLLADSPDLFPDGVWFAPLVAAENRDGLVGQLADTFQLPFTGADNPFPELLRRLAGKRLLLIADNCEQLLAEAPLFSQLLAGAGGVKLLATSRERLNLPEEWVIHLHGLAAPPAPDRSPALSLFSQRLRQVQPDFAPTGAEARWAGEICRMVGGMPLALELAAAWGDVLSCREIAGQLAQSMGILRSESLSLPERHRSMQAVLASSWQRLNGDEQGVMAGLSLFRGGFSREAAAAVTGASLPLLQGLIHRSLVRRTDDGRYELQELIRQYAAERLARRPEYYAAAQAAHARYFAGFIHAREKELMTNPSPALLDEVAAELENVRGAWRFVLERNEVELLLQMAQGFADFRNSRAEWSGFVDTEYLRAAAHCEQHWGRLLPEREGEAAERLLLAWGLLLSLAGAAQRRASRAQEFYRLNSRAIQQLRLVAERWPAFLANACTERSIGLGLEENIAESHRALEEAIHWAERANDPGILAGAYSQKGVELVDAGRLGEALDWLQQAAAFATQAGDRRTEVWANLRVGRISRWLGKYEEARQRLEKVYQLKAGFNNAILEWSAAVDRVTLLQDEGEFRRADEELRRLAGFLRQPNLSVARYCLVHLPVEQARMHLYVGENEEASQRLAEVLTTYVAETPGGPLEAEVRLLLAWLAQAQGNLAEALIEARRALSIYSSVQNPIWQAESLALVSQLHILAGSESPAAIRQSIDLALRLSQSTGALPVTLEALYALALLHAGGGVEEQAQAIRLLALIDRHAATRWETRQRAAELSQRLRGGLPLARFAALREAGFGLGLEAVVEREVGADIETMEIRVEA